MNWRATNSTAAKDTNNERRQRNRFARKASILGLFIVSESSAWSATADPDATKKPGDPRRWRPRCTDAAPRTTEKLRPPRLRGCAANRPRGEDRVVEYAEHALGRGAEATAAAYVEIVDSEGVLRLGVGVHQNIITEIGR